MSWWRAARYARRAERAAKRARRVAEQEDTEQGDEAADDSPEVEGGESKEDSGGFSPLSMWIAVGAVAAGGYYLSQRGGGGAPAAPPLAADEVRRRRLEALGAAHTPAASTSDRAHSPKPAREDGQQVRSRLLTAAPQAEPPSSQKPPTQVTSTVEAVKARGEEPDPTTPPAQAALADLPAKQAKGKGELSACDKACESGSSDGQGCKVPSEPRNEGKSGPSTTSKPAASSSKGEWVCDGDVCTWKPSRAKGEEAETLEKPAPAAPVQEVEPVAPSTNLEEQPIEVKLRFTAGGEDLLVEVRPSITVADWLQELQAHVSEKRQKEPCRLEPIFGGKVLTRSPSATLSALGLRSSGAVVVVIEKPHASEAAAPVGPSTATSSKVTVSRAEAEQSLWASLGVRWERSTRGSVPEGAWICGWEADGQPLYIARCRYEGGMQIGKLGAGSAGCRIGYGGREVILENCDVLCWAAKRLENGKRPAFVRLENTSAMPADAVPLGWEASGEPLYGARAQLLSGTHPGKTRPAFRACHIAHEGQEVCLPTFEVLCFGRCVELDTATVGRPATVSDATPSFPSAGPSRPSKPQSRGSSRSSSSSSGAGEARVEATLASFGLTGSLPWHCRMNEVVHQLSRESRGKAPADFLPAAVVARLPSPILALDRCSGGWHEGYKLVLGGTAKSVFCRIWGSQMGYMKLDTNVGFATEQKALELCREGGLPVPELLEDVDGQLFSGSCERGSTGLCDFALYKFIEGGLSEKEAIKLVGPSKCPDFELRTMIQIHKCPVGPRESTEPLARLETYEEQLQYLEELARSCEAAHLCRSIQAVKECFEQAPIPPLPPALLHLDFHMGNILISKTEQVLAVLDWEFACIGDPRFDLARHIRRSCQDRRDPENFRGGPELWEAYSELRFGGASSACLGPMDPWIALESLVLHVFTTVLCTRLARGQPVPRCDLEEWIRDVFDGQLQLQRLGIPV